MTAAEIPVTRLRNGRDVPEPTVRTTMLALHCLMDQDPITLIEMTSACRDPGHDMFGGTADRAAALGLIQDGEIPDSVRDVVLSAVTGEGLTLALRSPVENGASS